MHKVLERQLKRFLQGVEITPELQRLLTAVSDTYQHNDDQLLLNSRSLELSSQELEQSVNLQTATLDATADGIVAIDHQGEVLMHNARFAAMWGLPQHLAGVRQVEALQQAMARLLRSDMQWDLRYNPHGSQNARFVELTDGRVFEMVSRALQSSVGEGIVYSFRDATERRRNEKQREKLLREVQDANQELKDFAYVVSHDLKAPLRAIGSLANWIASDYASALDDDGKEQLALLVNRVNRMQALIDGILQYSRVARVREEIVEVDLARTLRDVVDLLSPPEGIRVELPTHLPVVHGEKTRLAQVFQNLLSNAVKYMGRPDGLIRVHAIEEGEHWRFGVEDNGPGIDSQYFVKIFQIFQTLKPRDEFESTGIGLSVVKRIVELHHGRIWVESEVGRGTTFWFTLPREAPVPATATTAVEPVLQVS
jgi:PAS domain S-box-containing protein